MSKKAAALPAIDGPKLAQIAGLTLKHINRLAREGVLPKARRNLFDTEKALSALITYYRNGREGSGTQADEKLRHTIAQRIEIEQRTAIKARQLLPVNEVKTAFDTAMTLIGSQLDGVAGRLAADLAGLSDPALCKKVIFDETRRIRTAAAAELEAFADRDERRGTPETSEGDHRG